MNEIKKAFKVIVNGSENHVLIEKCPAAPEDVMAALRFVDDTSELNVTLVNVKMNENGEYVEC